MFLGTNFTQTYTVCANKYMFSGGNQGILRLRFNNKTAFFVKHAKICADFIAGIKILSIKVDYFTNANYIHKIKKKRSKRRSKMFPRIIKTVSFLFLLSCTKWPEIPSKSSGCANNILKAIW